MKKIPIIFLRLAVVLIGIGVFAFLLWEPHIEGRNAQATLFEIYFKDQFLACAYIASIPFFVALYQVFALLGYIGRGAAFTSNSVRALRTIKYCAGALIVSLIVAEAYLFVFQRGQDDIAGGVAMGLGMLFLSVIVATVASVFEELFQSVVDKESRKT